VDGQLPASCAALLLRRGFDSVRPSLVGRLPAFASFAIGISLSSCVLVCRRFLTNSVLRRFIGCDTSATKFISLHRLLVRSSFNDSSRIAAGSSGNVFVLARLLSAFALDSGADPSHLFLFVAAGRFDQLHTSITRSCSKSLELRIRCVASELPTRRCHGDSK
jgi:hypothetical protein